MGKNCIYLEEREGRKSLKQVSLILLGLFLLTSIVVGESEDKCVVIYDFIIEHYNGTLNYLVYEFDDLKNETNLTTAELKDYLINYEDKCYLILPYEDYDVKPEKTVEKDTKRTVTDFIKSMFDNPQSFLMTICIAILLIILIKLAIDSK